MGTGAHGSESGSQAPAGRGAVARAAATGSDRAIRPSIVVIGSLNADVGVTVPEFPAPGATVLGGDLAVSPGGKGANQAVAAALTGGHVAMVGAVGADPFAELAVAGLREAAVDLGRVRTVDGATGTAVITVDARGENTIVVSAGANAAVGRDDVEAAVPLLEEADVLLMQGEIAPEVVDHAARVWPRLRSRVWSRVRAGRERRMILNAAPVTAVAEETLLSADPLVMNETEARDIAEMLGLVREGAQRSAMHDRPCPSSGEDSAGAHDIAQADDAAEALHEEMDEVCEALRDAGAPSVVVTLGAAGFVVADSSCAGPVHVESSPVTAIDSTGAGDMFVGALAAHLASGSTLLDAAELAGRAAASTVRFRGAQSSYAAAVAAAAPRRV